MSVLSLGASPATGTPRFMCLRSAHVSAFRNRVLPKPFELLQGDQPSVENGIRRLKALAGEQDDAELTGEAAGA
eukprot:11363287-Alexandrium_andersonii.AAC.1